MTKLPILIERRDEPSYVNAIDDEEDEEPSESPQPRSEPWYKKIVDFKTNDEYPPKSTKCEKRALRRLASQYILDHGELLKKTPHGIPLRCVDVVEGKRIIQDVHKGDCGTHMNTRMLCKKILRLNWYWDTMQADCIYYVKHCHDCQIFKNVQHLPPSPLYSLVSHWPFSTWGIDIIGKVYPVGAGGHCFILVAIDYFTNGSKLHPIELWARNKWPNLFKRTSSVDTEYQTKSTVITVHISGLKMKRS